MHFLPIVSLVCVVGDAASCLVIRHDSTFKQEV
jgi:hypothetical protein